MQKGGEPVEDNRRNSRRKMTVGLVAHVDAGKTTLSEALLYASGEIAAPGRVDHGNAYLDQEEIEKSRGITVFSKQARLHGEDAEIVLLDTPGHDAFSAEMERVLAVLDAAVLVISAPDGIEGHTRKVWELLKKRGIPVFIFVNKMDLAVRSREIIMRELRDGFTSPIIDMKTAPDGADFLDEWTLALPDWTERVLEGEVPTPEDIREAIRERACFPCFFGAALKQEGTRELLETLTFYGPYDEEEKAEGAFGARVYKIAKDARGERLTFLRVTSGKLAVRDIVSGGRSDSESWEEKVTGLRLYSGRRFDQVQEVSAGDLAAVTGLTKAMAGDGLGSEDRTVVGSETEPYLSYTVVPEEAVDPHRMLQDLKELGEEDPALDVTWIPETGEVKLRLMGEMQRDVLSALIQERYGYRVRFETGKIIYKEAIRSTVEGVGHFEPLRHYAEVHLILEPGDAGSGLVFDTELAEDELAGHWQNLILYFLGIKKHRGVLTGSALTDVKMTLVAGKSHPKHTEGGDFREATYRAVRQGLMQADSVLLEPWCDYRLELPRTNIGRAMTDIKLGGGSFGEPEEQGEKAVLRGTAPASFLIPYQSKLARESGGSERLTLEPAGYREASHAEEIIAAAGYDPLRDESDPSYSVFTEHGSSVIVPWDEVPEHMHLPSVLRARSEGPSERARAMEYARQLASDEELRAIFEKTYGKRKTKAPSKKAPIRRETEADRRREYSKKRLEQVSLDQAHVIVDGYNLIHMNEEWKELAKEDIGAAREALIGRLANYSGFRQCKLTCVFDAYQQAHEVGITEERYGITVVYTKEKETADAYISALTKSIGRREPLRVVSSDAAVQQMSLGHGAVRISSREFLEELEAMEELLREYIL